ncbi:cyclophilin-like fold protein [Asanoa iriomotensis]|uniref:Cyclophilin-like domain-containing protein n=1 Tax=Asanoa iriomotensis TaxID=234613 RepID=A0ABQ4C3U4_9ACTN|nr:cyclophilin-like fold protein [Asanoa iriomotensis]GIF57444.1 hypothetical protein Air01nite_35390 [Asanoa iriomotensis]
MISTVSWWIRRTAALMAVAVLAGCSVPVGPDVVGVGRPSAEPGAAGRVAVVLRFGDHVLTATLTDTPAAREFAAMLPLTVQLKDVWGQAKSGRLPRPLSVEDVRTIHDPKPGEIYFWPTTDVIAFYYDDLGQTVPDPGLALLGVLDAGIDQLADAGGQVTVQVAGAAEPELDQHAGLRQSPSPGHQGTIASDAGTGRCTTAVAAEREERRRTGRGLGIRDQRIEQAVAERCDSTGRALR